MTRGGGARLEPEEDKEQIFFFRHRTINESAFLSINGQEKEEEKKQKHRDGR